jgi:hypothetical protein
MEAQRDVTTKRTAEHAESGADPPPQAASSTPEETQSPTNSEDITLTEQMLEGLSSDSGRYQLNLNTDISEEETKPWVEFVKKVPQDKLIQRLDYYLVENEGGKRIVSAKLQADIGVKTEKTLETLRQNGISDDSQISAMISDLADSAENVILKFLLDSHAWRKDLITKLDDLYTSSRRFLHVLEGERFEKMEKGTRQTIHHEYEDKIGDLNNLLGQLRTEQEAAEYGKKEAEVQLQEAVGKLKEAEIKFEGVKEAARESDKRLYNMELQEQELQEANKELREDSKREIQKLNHELAISHERQGELREQLDRVEQLLNQKSDSLNMDNRCSEIEMQKYTDNIKELEDKVKEAELKAPYTGIAHLLSGGLESAASFASRQSRAEMEDIKAVLQSLRDRPRRPSSPEQRYTLELPRSGKFPDVHGARRYEELLEMNQNELIETVTEMEDYIAHLKATILKQNQGNVQERKSGDLVDEEAKSPRLQIPQSQMTGLPESSRTKPTLSDELGSAYSSSDEEEAQLEVVMLDRKVEDGEKRDEGKGRAPGDISGSVIINALKTENVRHNLEEVKGEAEKANAAQASLYDKKCRVLQQDMEALQTELLQHKELQRQLHKEKQEAQQETGREIEGLKTRIRDQQEKQEHERLQYLEQQQEQQEELEGLRDQILKHREREKKLEQEKLEPPQGNKREPNPLIGGMEEYKGRRSQEDNMPAKIRTTMDFIKAQAKAWFRLIWFLACIPLYLFRSSVAASITTVTVIVKGTGLPACTRDITVPRVIWPTFTPHDAQSLTLQVLCCAAFQTWWACRIERNIWLGANGRLAINTYFYDITTQNPYYWFLPYVDSRFMFGWEDVMAVGVLVNTHFAIFGW